MAMGEHADGWTLSHGYPSSTRPQLSNNPELKEMILGKNNATVLQMSGLCCWSCIC